MCIISLRNGIAPAQHFEFFLCRFYHGCIFKSDFLKRTGHDFDEVLPEKTRLLKEYGLIEDNGKVVKLTELGGFLADEVCEEYNSNAHKPFPEERYADGPLNPYKYNEM